MSVGEAHAARTFVELLRKERPDWDVRISTTTNTGQQAAQKLYGAENCFYFPLDFSPFVRRAFRRVRPDAILLMELEIWPNFLRVARGHGVPVVIVNGRMREERVGRYRALRRLFAPLYDAQAGNVFCVQSDTYRDRFQRAGFPADRIHVTGNMKYDAVLAEVEPRKASELRQALGLAPGDRAWVAACTWEGEEDLCLRVHRRLLEKAPDLRLIIAPRHIERADAVARCVESAGLRCRRRSKGGDGLDRDSVALLDTIGELGYLYCFTAFAFVGKSFVVGGGHNMLEPAALGAVPVFGPMTDNFANEAELLLSAGAAQRVEDEEALAAALAAFLEHPEELAERSRRGREAVRNECGASRRNLDIVAGLLGAASPHLSRRH